MITSATTLGALVGGLASGVTSDYLGRKWVIALANVIFIVGALVQSVSKAVPTMISGRLVIGLGVGVASCIAPLYIGELSVVPARVERDNELTAGRSARPRGYAGGWSPSM